MAEDSLLHLSTLGGASALGFATETTSVRLTVLGHPEPARVGATAVLTALETPGGVVAVSRTEPVLYQDDGVKSPLQTPFVSRRPVELTRTRTHVRIDPGPHAGRIRLDGRTLKGPETLDLARLADGVVLRLGQHVVLFLHQEYDRGPQRPMGMIGRSQAVDGLRTAIHALSSSDAPVLIRGETGAGKELVARAIHADSRRRSQPFLAVNMAAVPSQLAASQLFGHVRGSFSGAHGDQEGLFVAADGGVLFLDEIGDAPDDVQAALLRVLEVGEVLPVGATRPRKVDVRVVAATDMDLEAAVEEKRFRGPLFWRLAASVVPVPPLRERRADLGRLLVHFLFESLTENGRQGLLRPDPREPRVWLSADVVERLALHDWPGNVRELRNLCRAMAAMGGPERPLRTEDVQERLGRATPEPTAQAARLRPQDIPPELVEDTLRQVDWGLGAAAKQLGISRPALNDLVDAHPTLKRAKFLTVDEIDAARVEATRTGRPMWQVLRVSERALVRRLRGIDTPE